MNDFKIVYTVAEKGSMPREILMSLQSVNQFFDREDIIIYVTPPYSFKFVNKLRKYAKIKLVDNITKPFVFKKSVGSSFYGEKVHVCKTKVDTIIFLDCDTIMKKDIRPLLEGDYDISFRIGGSYEQFNMVEWKDMFSDINREPIPMPNAGFIIFKNGLHRKIMSYWLQYINDPELPNPHPTLNHKEQMALALSLPKDCKIKYMTSKEHGFRWNGDSANDCYIYHIGL